MQKRAPIEWQTVEHAYYEKTTDWYWIVGIVGGTLALLAILFGNWILGLLLIIAVLTMMLHGARRPGEITVSILPGGVRVGKQMWPYQEMRSFSIDEDAPIPTLVLDTRNPIVPDVRLFLEETSPERVRDYLLDHLDEIYHQPSFLDGLVHYLGF